MHQAGRGRQGCQIDTHHIGKSIVVDERQRPALRQSDCLNGIVAIAVAGDKGPRGGTQQRRVGWLRHEDIGKSVVVEIYLFGSTVAGIDEALIEVFDGGG